MAEELAQSKADAPDPVPLAPLDSGYNRDWNPQAFKSWLADLTKVAKLLAYDYVRFTEPQEAVRRAVADLLGNPTYVKEPQMRAWVPGKFDAEAVKTVAAILHKRAVGPEVVESDGVDVTDAMGGIPVADQIFWKNLMKASATLDQENLVDCSNGIDNIVR